MKRKPIKKGEYTKPFWDESINPYLHSITKDSL